MNNVTTAIPTCSLSLIGHTVACRSCVRNSSDLSALNPKGECNFRTSQNALLVLASMYAGMHTGTCVHAVKSDRGFRSWKSASEAKATVLQCLHFSQTPRSQQ